jgi:pimeloyl-ACP methyl ester carboxylesterase
LSAGDHGWLMAKARNNFVVLALLASFGSVTASPGDQRVKLPDGRMYFVTCAGKGTPTVILDAGWGSDHTNWGTVMPAIASKTRVCAVDRAGSGQSDPGPLPRDGKAVAGDLGAGLRAAKIKQPYVLVGASIGALYVRQFYDQQPGAVAGMVLVDGTVEHMQRRFETVFGPGAASLTPIILRARDCLVAAEAQASATPLQERCAVGPPTALRWGNRLSELETLFDATSLQLDQGRKSYGDLPIITLTAANTYPGAAGRLWFDLHKAVASRSSRGQSRLVADSGHNIARDQPEAVIEAVDDVIDMTRGKTAKR